MKRGIIGYAGVALAWAVVGPVPVARAQERDVPMSQPPPARAFRLLGGSGAYLGIRIEDVDAERAEAAGLGSEYGVYLAEVSEDGPAAEAGLQTGDVLVAWNGERLESVAQLRRLVGETPAGRTVELTAVRDGAERTVSVELGDRADAVDDVRVFTVPRERLELRDRIREDLANRSIPRSNMRVEVWGGRPRLGVSVQGLGEQLAEYFGVEDGALVVSVSEDSPAEAAGMRAGDVIVGIAGEEVDDPSDVRRILSDRDAGPVDVLVVRDGSERTLTVELEERDVGWDGSRFYIGGDEDGVWIDGVRADAVRLDPVILDGFEIGPIELQGFDLEIPAIEIAPLELPAIEIAPLELPRFAIPRRVVSVTI